MAWHGICLSRDMQPTAPIFFPSTPAAQLGGWGVEGGEGAKGGVQIERPQEFFLHHTTDGSWTVI